MAFYGNYSSLYPSASPLPEREDPYPTGYYRPHHFPSHTQVMMSEASSAYGPNLCSFPVGTDANVVYAFQMVDRDRSGCIDESELQLALSSGYQRFNRRTIKLLMFLYRNPTNPARFGPEEFTGLWSCLRQWRAIFGRFDRDCSGNIDLVELRDALHSIGYALPPSVLQLLISRYNDGSGQRTKLNFDNFVECGMIVKGLTEGFKKKDVRFSGSATVSYDTFMSMVIPYLVSYN